MELQTEQSRLNTQKDTGAEQRISSENLDDNKVIRKNQHGFLKSKSCLDQLDFPLSQHDKLNDWEEGSG